MLYRSIYIGNPAYLKLRDKQLKITDPETKMEKGSIFYRGFRITDA